MNWLVWTRDPKSQVTQFAYDSSGNVTNLLDARNKSYGFSYDLLNRRTSMIYPDNSHEDYSYNSVGNLYTYRNRAGNVRTHTYDERNRETQSSWDDGVTPSISRSYDASSRLLTLDNGVSALTYTYDDANQLLSETSIVGQAPSLAVVYSYDADGNRASMTYPDSTMVNYDYTGRNQLQTVASGQLHL
jgi:YD repeat-containing protein